MLTVDHTNRINAKDAMAHPFFDKVRDKVLEETAESYGEYPTVSVDEFWLSCF